MRTHRSSASHQCYRLTKSVAFTIELIPRIVNMKQPMVETEGSGYTMTPPPDDLAERGTLDKHGKRRSLLREIGRQNRPRSRYTVIFLWKDMADAKRRTSRKLAYPANPPTLKMRNPQNKNNTIQNKTKQHWQQRYPRTGAQSTHQLDQETPPRRPHREAHGHPSAWPAAAMSGKVGATNTKSRKYIADPTDRKDRRTHLTRYPNRGR